MGTRLKYCTENAVPNEWGEKHIAAKQQNGGSSKERRGKERRGESRASRGGGRGREKTPASPLP